MDYDFSSPPFTATTENKKYLRLGELEDKVSPLDCVLHEFVTMYLRPPPDVSSGGFCWITPVIMISTVAAVTIWVAGLSVQSRHLMDRV